jgi:hypothetical protein
MSTAGSGFDQPISGFVVVKVPEQKYGNAEVLTVALAFVHASCVTVAVIVGGAGGGSAV